MMPTVLPSLLPAYASNTSHMPYGDIDDFLLRCCHFLADESY